MRWRSDDAESGRKSRKKTQRYAEPVRMADRVISERACVGKTLPQRRFPDRCQRFVLVRKRSILHGNPISCLILARLFSRRIIMFFMPISHPTIALQAVFYSTVSIFRLATTVRFYYLLGICGLLFVSMDMWSNLIWPEIRGEWRHE